MLTRVTENLPGRITEPKALRALSHPTRWAIVDLLGLELTATATRCAEITGESVASCSYHLGMLAKYGFVEPAGGGEGREKPWKLVSLRSSWDLEDKDDEGQLAVEALNEVFIDHQADQQKAFVRRASREPPEWRRLSGSWSSTSYMTVAELAEITAELEAISLRYRDRITDPLLRPEGSRPVRLNLNSWLPRPPD